MAGKTSFGMNLRHGPSPVVPGGRVAANLTTKKVKQGGNKGTFGNIKNSTAPSIISG